LEFELLFKEFNKMARYVADQNKTVLIHESGTYATTSGGGVWIGLVTESDIATEINLETVRYNGTSSRNLGIFIQGAENVDVNLTYHPQNFQLLGFALGSIVDGGSPSPYTHSLVEKNNDTLPTWTSGTLVTHPSFTVEKAMTNAGTGTNFIQKALGTIINTYELSCDEGAAAVCSVNGISQSVTYSSGAVTAATEDTSKPMMWNDFRVQIPSGTSIIGLKNWTFSVNNSVERRNYQNGSIVTEVPIPLNRNYSLKLTIDGNDAQVKTYYDTYFKGGATFNCSLVYNDLSAGTGSRDAIVSMSGCRLTNMENPNTNEGTNEQTITITPKQVSAAINDLYFKYAPF